MFTCEICGKDFTNQNKLNGHKKAHRQKPQVRLWPCQLHISQDCEGMNPNRFNCNTCLELFKTEHYCNANADLNVNGHDMTGRW